MIAFKPYLVVAIAESIRRSIESARPLILIVDAGHEPAMAARRFARLLSREGHDDRCWRAPHYTLSIAAMDHEVGLAEGGMLYLDDIDSFPRSVLARTWRRNPEAWDSRAPAIVGTACPPKGAALVPWISRLVAMAERMGADIVDARAERAACDVCRLGPVPGAVIGQPTTCAGCRRRAGENLRGVHGRGPQEWQRKVDAVDTAHACVAKKQRGPYKWGWECSKCGAEMRAPEHDWDAMREARAESRGEES